VKIENLAGLTAFLVALGLVSAPALATVSGTYSVTGTSLDYTVESTDQANETVSVASPVQVTSPIPWNTRPEFKVNVTLDDTADSDAVTANDNTNTTFELPDKNANATKLVNSTGDEFSRVKQGDFDDDGYIEVIFGDGTNFQTVPAGSTKDVVIHYTLPKTSVSEKTRRAADLGKHTKYSVDYTVGAGTLLNYSNAEVKISPPSFEDRMGFVDLEHNGKEIVDFSTTDSSLKFTEEVLSDDQGNSEATVSYEVETAERTPAVPPARAPRRPAFVQQIVKFFRTLTMSVMSLFGGGV